VINPATFRGEIQGLFPEYYVAGQPRPYVEKYAARSATSEGQLATKTGPVPTRVGPIVPLGKVQRLLRPLYGKGEPHPPSIGDHPDFEHLRGTDLEEYCAITTLFMDMEGSTRLNVLFNPSGVAAIKNAFIRMAIEAVKAFDGHVHRIMGDAVMAYFGGTSVRHEDAAIDALNCTALLQLLVQNSVIPFLKRHGFDEGFGIRVGLDYGPESKVLWRSYGYPGMEEITATSFHVDVASKLQHAASRHEVMIGDSLRAFLDFPEELLSVKTVTEKGEEAPRPFLVPNITDAKGQPINYRQHVVNWERYLEVSPVALLVTRAAGTTVAPLDVSATLHRVREGDFEGPFIPTGTLGPKERAIRFLIRKTPFLPQLPYTIRCIVENHGQEASRFDNFHNHDTSYVIETPDQHRDLVHWENLAYRGLHYLIVELKNRAGLVARTKFGVYVE
jgi:class 3 adenylate cyclase